MRYPGVGEGRGYKYSKILFFFTTGEIILNCYFSKISTVFEFIKKKNVQLRVI